MEQEHVGLNASPDAQTEVTSLLTPPSTRLPQCTRTSLEAGSVRLEEEKPAVGQPQSAVHGGDTCSCRALGHSS